MKTIVKELNEAIANIEALSFGGKALDIIAGSKCHIYAALAVAQEYIDKEQEKEVEADG